MRSSRWGLLLAALLLGGALGGCATPMTAQVTSFHRIADPAQALAGQRFIIRPSEAQQGGLEFERYAGLVSEALASKGLVPAGSGPADVAVAIQYASTGTVAGGGAYAGGGTSGGISIGSGRGGGVSFGVGLGFPIGGTAPPEAFRHRRELRVTIDRIASGPGVPRLFEGQAVSEGASGALAPVMPALVRALFDEFPGKTGETRIVRVPVDDRERRP